MEPLCALLLLLLLLCLFLVRICLNLLMWICCKLLLLLLLDLLLLWLVLRGLLDASRQADSRRPWRLLTSFCKQTARGGWGPESSSRPQLGRAVQVHTGTAQRAPSK